MGWDNSAGEFIFGADVQHASEVITVNTFGNVHGNVFIGSGAGLSASRSSQRFWNSSKQLLMQLLQILL